MLRDGGAQFWCFLLADLSVGVQTAARVPLCPLFCRNPQVTSGKESLADGWGGARRRPVQPDGTKPITRPCGSLTLKEQGIHNAEKLYFSSQNTPWNPIKKCLYNHLYTRKNKERKHMKRGCKKPKTTLFCSLAMTKPQPLTKVHNEQAHLNSLREPFMKTFKAFVSQWNMITQFFMWDVSLFI